MQVMGISGMPGSGKSFISEIGVERGAIIVSMGDIIREEAKKRGEPTKETAVNLRKEFGDFIVSELTIEKIKKLQEEDNPKLVIIEGIRSHHEVDMFKENFENFIVLSVFSAYNKTGFRTTKQRSAGTWITLRTSYSCWPTSQRFCCA